MKEFSWKADELVLSQAPIVKVPLQFHFEPVEILSKQLTKLNSSYSYRILYLGPRWENSSIVHKKYAQKHQYKFNQKQINNSSTFFSETMSQNQFYRNQVYYRAFEGVNPTINKEEQLNFQSRFESGNLDCVVKVSDTQYDLFLRIDSNTKGHLFWFYFEVLNGKIGSKIRLNICNLTKVKSLYEKGCRPYTSIKSSNGQYINWNQDRVQNLKIRPKKLRYDFIYEKIKVRPLYQLSFQYNFTSSNSVRFAYCIPYTYTTMIKEINELGNAAQIGVLGKSLTGIDIPIIKIGNFEENIEKPIQFFMGRLHPGQSNGSIVLSGLMKHLCFSQQTSYLRKKVITFIVPMINPDGVILGNSRTGAAGKDLNRQFKTKNKNLFPEVNLVKKLVWKIQQQYDIQLFLDFHGHSRKKNMFLFGPSYNLTQPQYYKTRVIPKFISHLTSVFRYFGCNYTIPPCKMSTARAIMLNQIGIPLVYTVETSTGLFYDYQNHKDMPFTQAKWEQLGANICRALKQYFESIQQYEEFLKLKNFEQEQMKRKLIRNQKTQKYEKFDKTKLNENMKQKKVPQITQKDLKLFKLYEEIKATEENKFSKKKQDLSDADSDSQNDDDNLEKMKMAEFQGMVTQCIEVQIRKKEQTDQLLGKKKPKSPSPIQKKHKKRKKNLFSKEEETILTQTIMSEKEQVKTMKNEQIFVLRDERKPGKKTKSFDQSSIKHSAQYSEDKKPEKAYGMIKNKEYESLLANHYYIDGESKEHTEPISKGKSNNLKMFNFSKMVADTKKRSIMTSVRYRKQIAKSEKKNNNICIKEEEKEEEIPAEIKTTDRKYFHLSLEHHVEKNDDETFIQVTKKQEKTKGKGVFPAPFYRIKYQNYQKKKMKNIEVSHRKEQRQQIENTEIVNSSKKRRNDILFLKIKKFES